MAAESTRRPCWGRPVLPHRALLFIFLLLGFFTNLSTADLPPYTGLDADEYDRGEFGNIPLDQLQSSRGQIPRMLRRQWDQKACEAPGQYYFIAPHGAWIPHTGPEIIDTNGHQVWYNGSYIVSYDLNVQMFRGEKYLTWWSGNNLARDHGQGTYFMMDKHYRVFKEIEAVGDGMDGDLHDFIITEDNTAMFTVYHTREYDLTDFGIGNDTDPGYINDSLFQEVDIETNELLFQWRASDHVSLQETYGGVIEGKGETYEQAWDWFHINSVQKDPQGNYLVSSRYTHAVFYISGATGEVLWQLGGMNNNFTDLSDGRATNIARQHHARWHNNYTTITLFDNGVEAFRPIWRSRGLKIRLTQQPAMTAELIAEAYHPNNYTTASQGSVHETSSGNLLVGWGNTGAFTEFSADGQTVLCDWQYTALFAGEDGAWSAGAVESYRAYRLEWQGFPLEDPEVAFRNDGRFYVNWNGATELRSWVLEGSDATEEGSGDKARDWHLVERFERSGFESNVTVKPSDYKVFKLSALDAKDRLLGMWALDRMGRLEKVELPEEPELETSPSSLWPLVLLTVALISTILLLSLVLRHTSRAMKSSLAKIAGTDITFSLESFVAKIRDMQPPGRIRLWTLSKGGPGTHIEERIGLVAEDEKELQAEGAGEGTNGEEMVFQRYTKGYD